MSLPVPLSVRLRTATRDIHITDQIGDLTFGATSPGGYDNCQVGLHRPLRFWPGEVAQFGRLYVYDATAVVWEGRLQDPGRTAGSDGEVYELAAVGGQAHLQDDTVPLIYVDRDMTRWVKARSATGEMQTAQASAGETPSDGSPAIVCSFPPGLAVPTGAACTAAYYGLEETGQKLAVFDYSWDSGITSVVWEVRGYTSGAHLIRQNNTNTAGGGNSTAVVGITINFTFGDARPLVQMAWPGGASSTGTSDSVWSAFKEVVVCATVYNQDGTEKTTGYVIGDKNILASTVVKDLLGRLLSDTHDGAGATVSATSYLIDQLAYPDGVTPAKVLEDLLVLEPGYTHHTWESNPANDKFRFEFVPWPTTVRYEADITDGFSSPASGNTIFDRCRVRWRDARGKSRATLRTQTVASLGNAGFHRTAYLDLGDEIGSAAAATRAGDQFLRDHIAPVNAGRLTIARPVVDYDRGRMVQPWEIRPGNLIRVRGVESYPDALNPSGPVGRDGLTVFRVAATSYSSASASATLDLDSYAPSVARALGRLASRPVIRRR